MTIHVIKYHLEVDGDIFKNGWVSDETTTLFVFANSNFKSQDKWKPKLISL